MKINHSNMKRMLLQDRTDELAAYGDAVIPILIKFFTDRNPFVKYRAAHALVKIGKSAVPELIKALKDADPRVRTHAAWILGDIKDVSAVPALIIALGDACSSVKYEGADALAKIGDKRGLMFKRIIDDRNYNNLRYAKRLGLEKTGKVLAEFVRIIEKDGDLAKTTRVKLELVEFYGKVVARYNKANKGISVEGGELLKDSVKPPNGNNGMYRTVRRERVLGRT